MNWLKAKAQSTKVCSLFFQTKMQENNEPVTTIVSSAMSNSKYKSKASFPPCQLYKKMHDFGLKLPSKKTNMRYVQLVYFELHKFLEVGFYDGTSTLSWVSVSLASCFKLIGESTYSSVVPMP